VRFSGIASVSSPLASAATNSTQIVDIVTLSSRQRLVDTFGVDR